MLIFCMFCNAELQNFVSKVYRNGDKVVQRQCILDVELCREKYFARFKSLSTPLLLSLWESNHKES